MMQDDAPLDVLIIGAGLSGIGMAWHLQHHCPEKRFLLLEARAAMGGTWDLFRYPGVRSDSDMYTLGYRFRPWRDAKAIADGPAILAYIQDTAREAGIDRHIRTQQQVTAAHWSSEAALWHITTNGGSANEQQYRARFLCLCAGYYHYRQPIDPPFEGRADFKGTIVHPQFWPEQLDYAGKRVVVIGSGATAVTVVPAMAKAAAHVTMLQRSPTFYAVQPSEDNIANGLRRLLPLRTAYFLTRWKNVLIGQGFYRLTRHFPQAMKKLMISGVKKALAGHNKVDIARDFTPRYCPWDQRLCLVPDNDLFDAIKSGRAEVVTDTITRFEAEGIRLASGTLLPADIVVTATGLNIAIGVDLDVTVDGQRVHWPEKIGYKGLMFSDVPNFVSVFGYTNASWTLKADLSAEYVCRLLKHMDASDTQIAVPRNDDPSMPTLPFLDFSSTYVTRALDTLPKQGTRKPWRLDQNYFKDLMLMRHGRIDDGVLRFEHGKMP